jgi:Polysaccharide deacetylase
MTQLIAWFTALLAVTAPVRFAFGQAGKTEITKWQYGNKGAISLTYDDGSINQFRVAVPIMDIFGFPATFFIITGNIPGAQYHGTFVGRPAKEIIEETARVPTNKDNFFERASAVGFLGYEGTAAYRTHAGELYDEGKNVDQAYRVLDEAYAKVRAGTFKPTRVQETHTATAAILPGTNCGRSRIASTNLPATSVTHPRLAALDDANLVYELEMSRREMLAQLGFKHTFSVECPYGTENERAVSAALLRYQLARNHMPDANVDDLDRWNKMDPADSHKEYVRWQRGPLTETPMDLMKSWVDKTAAQGNVWLVLVFHGVDGVGWKPTTGAELKDYFAYINSKKQSLWVATFQDVAKYIRERTRGAVVSYRNGDAISVMLRSDITDMGYDLPLTLKTYVPAEWKAADVRQGKRTQHVGILQENGAAYILYQAVPNAEVASLSAAAQNE